MARYVIGDIQGCFQSLQALLEKIQFDPSQDHLWLAGDLVNRGPQSLEVLRWAKGMGDCLVTVLGNHDLHLISRYFGLSNAKPSDTLEEVLSAPDAAPLIEWLQCQPLVYREGTFLLVHGGLLPQWNLEMVETMAREGEEYLRGVKVQELLPKLPGKQNLQWDEKWKRMDRAAAFVKILTRMRICNETGEVNFQFNSIPESAPLPFQPWFTWPHRRPEGMTVFCGHWSALDFRRFAEVVALDSGCVWGRKLTAYRIEDGRAFQVNAVERNFPD